MNATNTRNRLRRWLSWRWAIVAVLLAVTCALGFHGFAKHFSAEGRSKSIFDLVYLTGQLFTMESGAVDGPLPFSLQVARFLGPLASAYAVVSAMLGLFTAHLRKTWIQIRGGHVVVCGLGRKAARLIEQLRSAGESVVVIEHDEQNPQLAQCRELGCHVVTGKANDPWNLSDAFVRRARVLLALSGDDGVNIETAIRAHELAKGRRGDKLRCISHVADPKLESIFRRYDVYANSDDPLELELFNTYETAARVMLRESRMLAAALPEGTARSHQYIIVGLGNLGEALLLRLLKDWQIDPPAGDARLRVTVIDRQADQRRWDFERTCPGLLGTAEVNFVAADVQDPGLASQLGDRYQAAFICVDDDAQGLHAAASLRMVLNMATPIVVRMSQQAGLASVLGAGSPRAGVVPGVIPVGMLDITCDLRHVLGGTREILAQAIHEGYVADQMAAGKSAAENASLAPWHRLAEELKNSNRQQADHIREKLAQIGCVPMTRATYPFTLLEFTADEVELLAELEHQRWLAERRAAGWTYGPTKDLVCKVNPCLVAWDALPEDAKTYNRDAVRRIPKVLAKADIEIHRGDAKPAPAASTLRPRRRATSHAQRRAA